MPKSNTYLSRAARATCGPRAPTIERHLAHFTGTMKGPMRGADGKDIPATDKSFDVEFCTVARWDEGQIVEENLFYDLVTFMKQIGLGA